MSIGEIEQGEVFPTPPRTGALIRLTDGTMTRFGDWTGKSAATTADGKAIKASDFEVLIPAQYGKAYARAVGLDASGHAGKIVIVTNWRSINVLVTLEGATRMLEWAANTIAVLAPPLNPATEKPAETVVRLTREKARLEATIHDRMVAEGVARGWCSEFDPILDATGLPPRHKKNVVTGVLTFTTQINERDYGSAEALLDTIRQNPMAYIPSRDVRAVEVKVLDDAAMGPMLSA